MSDARVTAAPESTPAPSRRSRTPVLGTLALVFAFGALFFPRFLVALPAVIAIELATTSLFLRERLIAFPVVAITVAIGLVALVAQPIG